MVEKTLERLKNRKSELCIRHSDSEPDEPGWPEGHEGEEEEEERDIGGPDY